MGNERVTAIVEELPLMRQMFDKDVYLTVIDAEGIIRGFSLPDGVAPQLEIGERFIDPSGGFDQVIATGKPKKNFLPEEVMGEPFEGMLVPIKEGREVVGCITCTYSVDIENQNVEIAAKFQEAVRSVHESIQTMVGGIESIFRMLSDMNQITNNVENDVSTAAEVVGKIKNTASRSNILALNASIEAARSGEYGKGFAVVANQMGTLANDSGSSAMEIKSTLDTITEDLVSIVTSIKEANDVAEEHMKNVSETQKILAEVMALSEKLEKNVNKQK